MGFPRISNDRKERWPLIERGAGGEYQLTDGLTKIGAEEGLLALEMKGVRHDIGAKFG